MKFRRQLGLTLMEVLVAVTVIMVTMSLVYLVGRKVKWMSYERICTSKMMKFSEALMVYRAEWGNVEADVGNGPYLGLPHSISAAARAIRVPGEVDAFEYHFCVLRPQAPLGGYVPWGYHPHWAGWKPNPEVGHLLTFADVTEVMRGATPIVDDPDHNPSDDPLIDPARPHRMLWISLDGAVHAQTLSGFRCDADRICWIHWWLKWYDEEAWKRLVLRPWR
jgi:hypothetical protein